MCIDLLPWSLKCDAMEFKAAVLVKCTLKNRSRPTQQMTFFLVRAVMIDLGAQRRYRKVD